MASCFDSLAQHLAQLLRGEKPAPRPSPFARYEHDPVGFARDVLGYNLWSKQREICQSVVDHRYTAVPSCHEVGKSFTAAVLCCWWIATRPIGDAFLVTTAPTMRQVKAILWREIKRAHRRGALPGKLNQTDWWIDGEMVGFGQKPSDFDPDAFQGIHALNVLVVLDEACGVPPAIWQAAVTLIGNETSRMLAIGNPDDPESEFARKCLPGSGYNVITIDALASPNFTDEKAECEPRTLAHLISPLWVEERMNQDGWIEGTPLYESKIRGRFPSTTPGGLIPAAWIRRAQDRWREHGGHWPKRPTLPESSDAGRKQWEAYRAIPHTLGQDVGGGRDHSVRVRLHGRMAAVIADDQSPDTMRTAGMAKLDLETLGATQLRVDVIGIGRGIVDRLAEQEVPVVGVNVALPPDRFDDRAREMFVNLRAQYWWALREQFRTDDVDIDPADHKLAGQLASIKYKYDSRGRILIESKDDMRKRNLPSPDHADALMLARAPIGREPGDLGITV